MLRYTIWGWAAVFEPDGAEEVMDPPVLRELAGFVDEEDLYATDFLGGNPQEDSLVAVLERSGRLRFAFREAEGRLRVLNEYVSPRGLTSEELQCLCKYTLAQWSDGMGECVFVPSGPFKDYKLQPLGEHEVSETEYPFVEVAE